jgi:hypothetical protein
MSLESRCEIRFYYNSDEFCSPRKIVQSQSKYENYVELMVSVGPLRAQAAFASWTGVGSLGHCGGNPLVRAHAHALSSLSR